MNRKEEKWAIFWCNLLNPIIFGEIEEDETHQFLIKIAKIEVVFPDGRVKKPHLSTLKRKLEKYQKDGFNGLARKRRAYIRKPRKVLAEVIEKAIELKKEQPSRSPKIINYFLNELYGVMLPPSTLYYHLKNTGITKRKREQVNFITHEENNMLEEWRKSKDKRKWEIAVAILDSKKLVGLDEISLKIERPIRKIKTWIRTFNYFGLDGLIRATTRKSRDEGVRHEEIALRTKRLLEIIHHKPKLYGINRSSWNLEALVKVYDKQFHEKISKSSISKYLKNTKYTVKKARKVLTSPDPEYREKVELLLRTLNSLGPDEMLFFVDELGPLRVKKYGGRTYTKVNETKAYPQNQAAKGSISLAGALSATTNQTSWIFTEGKDSTAMIDLIEILFNQFHSKKKLYITWDCASWHSSNSLVTWLESFNTETEKSSEGPIIEFIPLPTNSQFLDVIEAVFSGMKRAVIHNSDYQSAAEMEMAISLHFQERNDYFKENPKRVGKKIWEIDFFSNPESIKSGTYREW